MEWTPGENGHPSIEWLRILWERIGEDPNGCAAVRGWPLLPVVGGNLVRLGSAVLEDGSWSAAVGSALAKLGCRLLDASAVGLDVGKVGLLVGYGLGALEMGFA